MSETKAYASLSWCAEDVVMAATEAGYQISAEQAETFLANNQRHILDRLTERGFDVIETLLIMDADELGLTQLPEEEGQTAHE